MPGWGLIYLIAIAAVLLLLYFLPFIVALSRGHRETIKIFMLTLFLGWTIVGWIVALVWSSAAVQPRGGDHR